METIVSGGKSLRIHRATPAVKTRPVPAILLLHGAGGNVLFWFDRVAQTMTTQGFAVFAVHYFDRTGTTRAETAELRDGVHIPLWIDAIRDTLVHMAQQENIDGEQIALMGISLGAFLSLSLTAEATGDTGQAPKPYRPLAPGIRIRAVVDISGGLIPPWRGLVTESFPPTLIVHGDQDSVVAVAHAHGLDATLTKLRVEHTVQIFAGESHWFTPAAQASILSLAAGFLRDRLRTALELTGLTNSDDRHLTPMVR